MVHYSDQVSCSIKLSVAEETKQHKIHNREKGSVSPLGSPKTISFQGPDAV